VSEKPSEHSTGKGADHSKIHTESGGGGGKWLLGAAAAIVLIGGGYFAWKNFAPAPNGAEMAYNDSYADGADPLRAGPLASDAPLTEGVAESASVDAAPTVAPATPRTTTRRAPVRTAEAVPEETIGITPISATSANDGDDIVVTAARRPIWSRTPSERRLSALYPERALERGREGEARLACIVQESGALDCDRVAETPGGFGAAAVRVARTFRHAPQLADGSAAVGTPVNLRVVFRIADEDRRRG
jgi:TonB family protein